MRRHLIWTVVALSVAILPSSAQATDFLVPSMPGDFAAARSLFASDCVLQVPVSQRKAQSPELAAFDPGTRVKTPKGRAVTLGQLQWAGVRFKARESKTPLSPTRNLYHLELDLTGAQPEALAKLGYGTYSRGNALHLRSLPRALEKWTASRRINIKPKPGAQIRPRVEIGINLAVTQRTELQAQGKQPAGKRGDNPLAWLRRTYFAR